MAFRRSFYLFCASLIVSSLLLNCQTWDLPLRKTQRQCTAPSGQLGRSTSLLQATLTVVQPAGTIDRIDWDFGDAKTQSATGLTVGHTYTTKGNYTVKATLTNLCGQTTTLSTTVTVSDVMPPDLGSLSLTNLTKTGATLRIPITNVNKGVVSEYGVCYSKTNPVPTVGDQTVKGAQLSSATQGATLSLDITGLEPRVLYYVRAYARNEANPTPADPSYSDILQFRVLSDPLIELSGTPAVSGTSALVTFRVTDLGNPVATQYGVTSTATDGSATINSSLINLPGTTLPATLSTTLTGLPLDKDYTYRPYAVVNGTTAPGPLGTFSTIDLTSDLIVNVPFTNASMIDQSGNNNNAYPVNNPTFVADRKNVANSAIQLNGNGQYFYFIDNTQLRSIAALTVSFWIRVNGALTDPMQLYNKSRFGDSYGEQYSSLIRPATNGITINTDIKQNSNCIKSTGWQTFPVTSNFDLTPWKHVVFTYEGRTARMYLDGVLLSQKTDLPNSSIDNCDGGELKFGAQIRDYPQYFRGAMDDIRVYRRALTAVQVKTLTAQ